MRWVEQSRGFWRSACGRFDVLDTPRGAVVYDWTAGRRAVFGSISDARAWCERRAG